MSELDLFAAAVAIPDPTQRASFLDRECAANPALRQRLEHLLEAHFRSHELLDQPAPEPNPTASYAPEMAAGALIAGRYKLLQQIGEGGMGAVWMADQTEPVKRRVAVKLIRVERAQLKMILSRFEAERQAIALMDHPNIAKLLDAGVTQGEPGGVSPGSPFFVMELVKGKPLTDFCDEHRLGIPERLALFMQVCSAVQHAHQKGVIHRDLKPTNILVESHDGKPVPKVIDFGLAKATHGLQLTEHTLFTAFGNVMGTPLYMAPEQATFNAVDVDTRADVYALGVILYELLTGATPLSRETIKKAQLDEMLRLIREQDAPTPSSRLSTSDSAPSIAANRQTEPAKLGRIVKGELDWIVLKALSKERDRRYETALGFSRDIERFLHHEPVAAGPPTAGYRLRKFIQRNRGLVIAASLVALTLVLGIAGTTWGLFEARRFAEAERIAKIDAQTQKVSADRSAEAEKVANETTRKRLAQIEKANDILGSIFENLDPKEIARAERPLQATLVEKLDQAVAQLEGESIGDPLVVAAMQIKFGNSLLSLGEPDKAIVLLKKARAARQAKLGPEHPDTLQSMNNLAAAYQAAGNLDLAQALFEETFTLLKAKLGPEHPDTLTSMNNLALACSLGGKSDLALLLFEKTLKLQKAKLGPEHPDTLTSMNNLAAAYQAAGKRDLAMPILEETLKLRKAKLGPEHPDTLQSMNNLAVAYQDAGKQDLALPLSEETLKLRKARLGPEHPATLTSMNNLALAYQAAGRLDLALPLFEETLKLRKAKLGSEHPETFISMNNLAGAYRDAGKRDLATPILEETLKLRKAKLGPEHPDTFITMNNLALAYQAAGRLDLALPLFEEALRLRKAKLGPEHPDTLGSMNNLAAAYQHAGKRDQALPLFEETLKLQKAKIGPEHPHTLICMYNLGVAYCDANQGEKAAATLKDFVAGRRKRAKPDGPQFAGQLAQVALDLLKCRQHAAAEEMLRECLAIREKKQPDDWTTFNTKSLLGGALLGQKKYAEAEPLLLAGYEGMKQRAQSIVPKSGTRIPEALDRLIEFYTATNKPDEVKKWQSERAKYPPPEKPKAAK